MAIDDSDVTDAFKEAQTQGGGTQIGGGPGAADQNAAGGSSGTGGYGGAMDASVDEGDYGESDRPVERELSRGERYDMEQGGGRGPDSVDFQAELQQDPREQQGQRFIDEHGAVTEGQQP